MKRLALTLILVSMHAGPVGAGWDEGIAAYERGDYETALRELYPLAEQGDAKAQNNLGDMYCYGHGVPQDYAEAVRWYLNAAEQGYAAAQPLLGNMYEEGKGFPQDYVLAHMWFNLAASQLPPGITRDSVVNGLDEVAREMTPAQITEAQRLAREWKPNAQ